MDRLKHALSREANEVRESVDELGERLDADILERAHRRHVQRGGERRPQCDRAAEPQVVVHRLVDAVGASEGAGYVEQWRGDGVSVLERR